MCGAQWLIQSPIDSDGDPSDLKGPCHEVRFLQNAIALGLFAAIGPFAIDMYLPALPPIAADLGASTAATQMTLMAFFIAFGVGQIVYGPMSDMIGRKPPLYFGLGRVRRSAASAAGWRRSIEWLIFFRFIQGIGAAAVHGDAARDHPRPAHRRRGDAPDVARHAGLQRLADPGAAHRQRADRALRLARGLRRGRRSSRSSASSSSPAPARDAARRRTRMPRQPRQRPRGFGSSSATRRFLGLTFIGGLGMASFFAFLASSSFIYIDHFGLTPTEYSLAFSVNAIGFIGASQFAAKLGERYGLRRVIVDRGASPTPITATLLFALTAAGVDNLATLHGGAALRRLRLPGLVIPLDDGAGAGGARARSPAWRRRSAARCRSCRRADDRDREPSSSTARRCRW